ncbi:Crp/Fnr family transcriptional regulator [Undibacterium seohonense]|jgi:CRP/FNR family cyclic AMP-dependent transcriptional regulator|uniref:Crp/Fnr family transcriptional regulator n=1 Tax=Undibacterium seohonense TaxID=1344950 RepID=A0ABR6WZX5_9BURK|nr:Crp/Fnr family transcriptional regulator [Undibacterium seohonense]MBC3806255.1 Crp/Fnr family transcriptional regulator [Undibacterium seohonense]
MPIALEIAANIPLFKDFDEPSLKKVANLMSCKSFQSHDIVMRKGDTADSLAFLISGKLQVVDLSEEGREIGIHFIQPGAYFGELSVIDGQPRSASVISVKLSEVAFLPSGQARELIFHHPLIAKRLLTHFAQIVRSASSQRTLLSIPNAFQRVFAQLQTFVRESKDGQVIEGLPKQHEIAIMVNTSRETVSRAIHTLMKMNILEKQGTILIVRKPEQLKHVATVGVDDPNTNKK